MQPETLKGISVYKLQGDLEYFVIFIFQLALN